jgi:CDP-glucose 4,6-dehydratase
MEGVGAVSHAYWSGRRVLVTGAYGFVASWLQKALLERGAVVVGLDRQRPARSCLQALGLDGQVILVHADVRDADEVERALNEHDVSVCFHLAAQALVGAANRSPVGTFEANIRGTYMVLEACRRLGSVESIVVASSDKAYGAHEALPYTESHALQPRYPYDVSKACADLIARSFHATFGLPVAVTRCANIYGGGDLNLSRLVPGTMVSVLRGERPVIRSDGTPERDYLHVDDAVAAYLALAEQVSRPQVAGRAFNFGTNRPVSVLDLFGMILRAAGREDLQPEILGQASGEIDRQFMDSGQARATVGWEPKVGLEEGLHRTWEWYRDAWNSGYLRDGA